MTTTPNIRYARKEGSCGGHHLLVERSNPIVAEKDAGVRRARYAEANVVLQEGTLQNVLHYSDPIDKVSFNVMQSLFRDF